MQDVVLWDSLQLSWKDKVAYLTHQFLKLPQIGCPVKHSFDGDTYIREMVIPCGSLFIGRAHNLGHRCELVSGSVIHITPEGKRQIDAPFAVHTTPGYHMVMHALTDVVGRTYHPAHGSTDTQALEDEYFESAHLLSQRGQEIALKFEAITMDENQ